MIRRLFPPTGLVLLLATVPSCTAPFAGDFGGQNADQIPAEFTGTWSISADKCTSEKHASEWLYVGEDWVGSFEHMYPVRSVAYDAGTLTFYSLGAGHATFTLAGESRIMVRFGDSKPTELVRCESEEGF